MQGSPIFVKTYDMLLWLMRRTASFPREHRFVMAQHVQKSALSVQELFIEAASLPRQDRRGRLERLQHADVALTKLRFYLRLCRDLNLLDAGQHRHVSQMVDEIGRLLGGWVKQTRGAAGAASGQEG